jgi:hypothetical protein
MLTNGARELADHGGMDWGEVTALEPEFIDEINQMFGMAFVWDRFAGG